MLAEAILILGQIGFVVALPFLVISFLKKKKKDQEKDNILSFLNRVDPAGEWAKYEGSYIRRKG